MEKDTIKRIFDEEWSHLEIDVALAKRIHEYFFSLINKNEDHITFFGGNLMGVQTVRFNPSDSDRWFIDVLRVDESLVSARIANLDTIQKNWKIASNTLNLSCAWLLHRFEISKLPEKVKHSAMIDIAMFLQFKFLTSLMFGYFKYPADKQIAEATYSALSNKFDIKQYGSWSAMLRARAEQLIQKRNKHYKAILNFEPDAKVVYLVNDVQGGIRSIMKYIYKVFKRVHEQGTRFVSVSSVVEHDGEEVLRDRTKSISHYTTYLNSIITDKNSFVRIELIAIVEEVMKSMSVPLLTTTLKWMSDHFRERNHPEIETLINETLIHSFYYLNENKSLVRNKSDLPGLLDRLRGVYTSSRSTDQSLFLLRNLGESIVKKATNNRSTTMVASVRTGLLLYIVLRAYTMKYYSGGD